MERKSLLITPHMYRKHLMIPSEIRVYLDDIVQDIVRDLPQDYGPTMYLQ